MQTINQRLKIPDTTRNPPNNQQPQPQSNLRKRSPTIHIRHVRTRRLHLQLPRGTRTHKKFSSHTPRKPQSWTQPQQSTQYKVRHTSTPTHAQPRQQVTTRRRRTQLTTTPIQEQLYLTRTNHTRIPKLPLQTHSKASPTSLIPRTRTPIPKPQPNLNQEPQGRTQRQHKQTRPRPKTTPAHPHVQPTPKEAHQRMQQRPPQDAPPTPQRLLSPSTTNRHPSKRQPSHPRHQNDAKAVQVRQFQQPKHHRPPHTNTRHQHKTHNRGRPRRSTHHLTITKQKPRPKRKPTRLTRAKKRLQRQVQLPQLPTQLRLHHPTPIPRPIRLAVPKQHTRRINQVSRLT